MPLGTNGNACADLVAPSPEPEVVVDAVPAPVETAPEVVEPVAVVEAPNAETPVAPEPVAPEPVVVTPVIVALDKTLSPL